MCFIVYNYQKNIRIIHENSSEEVKTILENIFGEDPFDDEITNRIVTCRDAYHELGLLYPDEHIFSFFEWANDNNEAYEKLKVIVKALNEGWPLILMINLKGYISLYSKKMILAILFIIVCIMNI